MASFAIIYATGSKALRRVISDDDGQLSIGTLPDGITPAVICANPGTASSFHPIANGETAFLMPVSGTRAAVSTPAQWAAAIQARTGVVPPIIVCALVDAKGVVVQLIHADPAIDAAPDGFVMVQCYSPQIAIGQSYDAVSGLFSYPQLVIPPDTPGNRTAVPVVVPPAVIPRAAASIRGG